MQRLSRLRSTLLAALALTALSTAFASPAAADSYLLRSEPVKNKASNVPVYKATFLCLGGDVYTLLADPSDARRVIGFTQVMEERDGKSLPKKCP